MRKKFLIFTLFIFPALANAGTAVCTGKLTLLAIHQPGIVALSLSSMNIQIQICSLNGDWIVPGSLVGNTSAAGCKAIYATLLAGRYSDRSFDMIFDGDQVPASCTNFVAWTNVNLRFVNAN